MFDQCLSAKLPQIFLRKPFRPATGEDKSVSGQNLTSNPNWLDKRTLSMTENTLTPWEGVEICTEFTSTHSRKCLSCRPNWTSQLSSIHVTTFSPRWLEGSDSVRQEHPPWFLSLRPMPQYSLIPSIKNTVQFQPELPLYQLEKSPPCLPPRSEASTPQTLT